MQSNDQHFFQRERTLMDEIRDGHKAMSDLWQGVSLFSHVKNCITVYGSARFKEGHQYYELARSMGKALAENGFAVMTGGGPGVMEAANRGAREGGGPSFGCNIKLPFEQKLNPYIDEKVEFEFFFTRKVILRKNSVGFVLMPGGLGTMDEIFEVLTLLQTGKLPDRPVVCMGSAYWKHLGVFLKETMIETETISDEDLNLVFVTDDPEEGVRYIKSKMNQIEKHKKELADIY